MVGILQWGERGPGAGPRAGDPEHGANKGGAACVIEGLVVESRQPHTHDILEWSNVTSMLCVYIYVHDPHRAPIPPPPAPSLSRPGPSPLHPETQTP